MKRYFISILLFLTACSSLPPILERGSKCIYEVEGLNCTREPVFTPRDNAGFYYDGDNTWIWFKDLDKCKDFIKDKKNQEFLRKNQTYISHCGYLNGDSAFVALNYVYDDHKGKDDIYYYYTNMMTVSEKDVNRYGERYGERTTVVFTSISAIKTFKKQFEKQNRELFALSDIRRIKIIKMY